MVEKKKEKGSGDTLVGMDAICRYMGGISYVTALKWYREEDMPIEKRGGVWVASKKNLDDWNQKRSKATNGD